MHCVHCGAEIPDYAKFCTSCGKPQIVPTEAEQPEAAEPTEETREGTEYAAPEYASEGYKAANDHLPASYSDPNYSSQSTTVGAASAPSNTNALAIAGVVCSLIFVPVGFGVLTAIAGLVLSILGLNTAKKMPGNKGHGLALAGTIISAIRVVLILIGLVALIALMFRGVGRVGHEIITNWQDYVPYYH